MPVHNMSQLLPRAAVVFSDEQPPEYVVDREQDLKVSKP